MATALGLLIFINTSDAQLTPADAAHFSRQLHFTNIKSFEEARVRLKSQTNATNYLKTYLPDKTARAQLSQELGNILPEVEKSLKANPEENVLVSVTIDSATNAAITQHTIRSVQIEGSGDTALQSLSTRVFSNLGLGSSSKTPAEGLNYDPAMSHVLCFGIDDQQIKATAIFVPDLRADVNETIKDLQKAQAAPKRPQPPGGLRIRVQK